MQEHKEPNDSKDRLPAVVKEDAAKWPLIPIKYTLECFALWPEVDDYPTRAQHIFYCLSYAFLIMGEVYYMKIDPSFGSRIFTLTWLIDSAESVIRRILCYLRRERLVKLLHGVYFEFWSSDRMGPKLHNELQFQSWVFLFYGIIFMCLGGGCCIVALILSMKDKFVPLLTAYPFDWDPALSFAAIYVWQSLLLVEMSFNIIGVDLFVASLLLNCSVQYRLLCKYLKDEVMKATDAKAVKKILVVCIKHHYQIVMYCREIEDIFSYFILVSALANIVAICLTSFTAMVVPNALRSSLLSFVAYIMQMFLFCYVGEILSSCSRDLSDAAYECGWHLRNANRDVQKSLVLIMVRSQRPILISAGGFGYLNLANFMKLLQFSFSVFTLLRNMDLQQEEL